MGILQMAATVAWDSESFQRSRRKDLYATKDVAINGAMPVDHIAILSPCGLVDLLLIRWLWIVIIRLLVAGGRFPV